MMKTVTMVDQVWRNVQTQALYSVSWNSDDGALLTYSGPGPGWEKVSESTRQQQVTDYEQPARAAVSSSPAPFQAGPAPPNIPGSPVPVENTAGGGLFSTLNGPPTPAMGPFGPLSNPQAAGSSFSLSNFGLKGVALVLLGLWLLRRL